MERDELPEYSKYKGKTSLGRLARFKEHVDAHDLDETRLCQEAIQQIRACLSGEGEEGSERLQGRAMGGVWKDIVELSFSRTGTQHFQVPRGTRLSDVRRQLEYKLVLNHGVPGAGRGDFISASATWLQLPYQDLQWLVDVLYEHVTHVAPDEEARRLDLLSSKEAWSHPSHRLIADLVKLNGLGKVLWCCAPLVIDMMHVLWDTCS